jgi:hypothetical protein
MIQHNSVTRVLFLASFCSPVAFGFVAVPSQPTPIHGYFDRRVTFLATNRCSEQPRIGRLFTSPVLRSEFRGQSVISDLCDSLPPITSSNFPRRGALSLIMRSFPGRKSQEKKRQCQTHHALSKVSYTACGSFWLFLLQQCLKPRNALNHCPFFLLI